jgi:hypothetical protein
MHSRIWEQHTSPGVSRSGCLSVELTSGSGTWFGSWAYLTGYLDYSCDCWQFEWMQKIKSKGGGKKYKPSFKYHNNSWSIRFNWMFKIWRKVSIWINLELKTWHKQFFSLEIIRFFKDMIYRLEARR